MFARWISPCLHWLLSDCLWSNSARHCLDQEWVSEWSFPGHQASWIDRPRLCCHEWSLHRRAEIYPGSDHSFVEKHLCTLLNQRCWLSCSKIGISDWLQRRADGWNSKDEDCNWSSVSRSRILSLRHRMKSIVNFHCCPLELSPPSGELLVERPKLSKC